MRNLRGSDEEITKNLQRRRKSFDQERIERIHRLMTALKPSMNFAFFVPLSTANHQADYNH